MGASEKKQAPRQRNSSLQKDSGLKVEEELDALEKKINELDDKLLEIEDVEILQEMYSEKEALEKKWETLVESIER
ncbi:hypothetical protein [Oceanobacillus luteolus]|uniref:hypothetical protein n=1 Tax=Oceanobacillus luteolus TaxID=1274358 RepID=UPI0036D3C7F0